MGFFDGLFGGGSKLDAARVRELVAGGSKILDVRTPEEFAGGHINGAINIPVQVLPQRIADVGPKDRPVIVYCRSGGRSSAAKGILTQAGYADVIDVGPMSAFPQ